MQSPSVKAESNSRQAVNPSGPSEQPPESFAFDGRYVYFGRSRFHARDRMYGMSDVGLSKDPSLEEMVSNFTRRAVPAYITSSDGCSGGENEGLSYSRSSEKILVSPSIRMGMKS